MKTTKKILGGSIAITGMIFSLNAIAGGVISTNSGTVMDSYQSKYTDKIASTYMSDRLSEVQTDAGQVSSSGVFQDATGAQKWLCCSL